MAQCAYGNNELDNHIVVTGRVKYIEAFSMDAGIKNDLAVTCKLLDFFFFFEKK